MLAVSLIVAVIAAANILSAKAQIMVAHLLAQNSFLYSQNDWIKNINTAKATGIDGFELNSRNEGRPTLGINSTKLWLKLMSYEAASTSRQCIMPALLSRENAGFKIFYFKRQSIPRSSARQQSSDAHVQRRPNDVNTLLTTDSDIASCAVQGLPRILILLRLSRFPVTWALIGRGDAAHARYHDELRLAYAAALLVPTPRAHISGLHPRLCAYMTRTALIGRLSDGALVMRPAPFGALHDPPRLPDADAVHHRPHLHPHPCLAILTRRVGRLVGAYRDTSIGEPLPALRAEKARSASAANGAVRGASRCLIGSGIDVDNGVLSSGAARCPHEFLGCPYGKAGQMVRGDGDGGSGAAVCIYPGRVCEQAHSAVANQISGMRLMPKSPSGSPAAPA
ncbi:hypothetical protein B0H17DRAFT_1134328 [Mycena rosella]|uniref:Uncharacterized protein n=1 Tax=Mycena rosella TaxID=1033263 RepID=A0AAD7GEC5_MYCRO|nr:hypothetical protein B0H17DRAFT_1134328 [Mycena rosella]